MEKVATHEQTIDRRLRNTVESCVSTRDGKLFFSADSLFAIWFRKKGKPYYFLFRKNLSRTNIQFAELISLIRLHAQNKETNTDERNLHFFLVSDFLRGVQEVVNDLLRSEPSKAALCRTFLSLYADVLRHSVLLDVFYGSCSVFFPPHLEINLFKVCSESGYIHSCGLNIFSRRLGEANDTEFRNHVTDYVKHALELKKKKAFFVVYSHEDFTQHDRAFAAELRGGLDDVKIYAEKYFLGSQSLVRVLQELSKDSSVHIAAGGNFQEHKTVRDNDPSILSGRTIWLIVDHMVGNNCEQLKGTQFLICYDQIYKNENPLHLFNENKPAWVAHTTLPHDLVGAMLNIARPMCPRNRIDVYDPFSGTGTTALEALKLDGLTVVANDKSSIGELLLRDNRIFFGNEDGIIEETQSDLEELAKLGCAECVILPAEHRSTPSPYFWAIKLFERLNANQQKSRQEWFDIPSDIVAELAQGTFRQRLRFYLALRTKLRHVAAFERGSEKWLSAYRREVQTLLFQVNLLVELQGRIRNYSEGLLIRTSGIYSDGCTINHTAFRLDNGAGGRIIFKNLDARISPGRNFDLILTDPPYGFNNDLNALELAALLTATLDTLIRSLKPKGQLIVCLPDVSHSGRRIPIFATREWVTQQIIAKAVEHGFNASIPASILPRMGHLFHPPYFWDSEKALRRAILHFEFHKKKTTR